MRLFALNSFSRPYEGVTATATGVGLSVSAEVAQRNAIAPIKNSAATVAVFLLESALCCLKSQLFSPMPKLKLFQQLLRAAMYALTIFTLPLVGRAISKSDSLWCSLGLLIGACSFSFCCLQLFSSSHYHTRTRVERIDGAHDSLTDASISMRSNSNEDLLTTGGVAYCVERECARFSPLVLKQELKTATFEEDLDGSPCSVLSMGC